MGDSFQQTEICLLTILISNILIKLERFSSRLRYEIKLINSVNFEIFFSSMNLQGNLTKCK